MPKRKAYYVEEASKGTTLWLVHARSGKEARENYFRQGVAIDSQHQPNGIRSVKRAPEEDEDG